LGCRRVQDTVSVDIESLFFKSNNRIDPRIQSISTEIYQLNKEFGFVRKLARKVGLPAWDHARIFSHSNSSELLRSKPEDSIQYIFIPFVQSGKTQISSILAIMIEGGISNYKLVHSEEYSLYGFDYSIGKTTNARSFLSLFAYFNNEIFGYNEYVITDEKLLNSGDQQLLSSKRYNFSDVIVHFRILDTVQNACENCSMMAPCLPYAVCFVPQGFTGCSTCNASCIYFAGYTNCTSDWGGNIFEPDPNSPAGQGGGGGPAWWDDPCDEDPSGSGRVEPCNGITGWGPIVENGDVLENLVLNLNLNAEQENWLVAHPAEASTLYYSLLEADYSDPSKQAALITIDVSRLSIINQPITSSAHLAIFQSHLSPELVYPYTFSLYFSIECATLKIIHPDWSEVRIYFTALWNTFSVIVHTGLDAAGLIPIIGEVADLTNGIIYTLEGDGVNATLSFASTIPFAGWYSTSAKYANKLVTAIDGSKRTLKWIKQTNGLINFGDRGLLRKVLGLAKGDPRAAHHLIPWEHGEDLLIQKAAQKDFNLNEALNGIPLTSIQHNGSHNIYNQKVKNKLVALWNSNGGSGMSTQTATTLVRQLANDIRNWIIAHPNESINNITL